MAFTLSQAVWVDDLAPDKSPIRTLTARSQLGDMPTRTEVASLTIPAAVMTLQTSGETEAGDTILRRYKRVDADPGGSADKVRSSDRFLSDGSVDNTHGGYWLRVTDIDGEEVAAALDAYFGNADWRTGGGGAAEQWTVDSEMITADSETYTADGSAP